MWPEHSQKKKKKILPKMKKQKGKPKKNYTLLYYIADVFCGSFGIPSPLQALHSVST